MARSGSVPLEAYVPSSPSAAAGANVAARHSALVRVTHWIITLCFLALLVSGIEILISHPRFYWGETGNVLTKPLFIIPIPSSRVTSAHRLRLRAAGSERLEPLSSLSSGVDRGTDRLALCNLRRLYRAFPEKPVPRRRPIFPGGRSRATSPIICASSGRVSQKPGRTMCSSASPT